MRPSQDDIFTLERISVSLGNHSFLQQGLQAGKATHPVEVVEEAVVGMAGSEILGSLGCMTKEEAEVEARVLPIEVAYVVEEQGSL